MVNQHKLLIDDFGITPLDA